MLSRGSSFLTILSCPVSTADSFTLHLLNGDPLTFYCMLFMGDAISFPISNCHLCSGIPKRLFQKV